MGWRKPPESAHSGGLRHPLAGAQQEHLLLEFRGGVFVYVPASKIDLVQKYVGSSQSDPELSKFGGTGWQRRKEKVEETAMYLAPDTPQRQTVPASEAGCRPPTHP